MTDESGAVRRAEDFVRSYPTLATLLLLLPLFLLLIAFFVVPLLQLLNLSLLAQQPTVQNPTPAHTVATYARILGDSFYLQVTGNSILVGFCTTVTTLLVAYPVAYYITRISGWERTLISVACLLPLFVNVIVGILGWYILLLPNGVIQQVLAVERADAFPPHSNTSPAEDVE